MGMAQHIHASYHPRPDWNSIQWKKVGARVKKLQMRIAKAVRERRYRLVKSLQWLLTHSFYAKLFAVRRVVTNKGRRTPGVDGEIWNTPKKKAQGIHRLRQHGYRTQPRRRIYIPKKDGKRKRPLGIPICRSHCTSYNRLSDFSCRWAEQPDPLSILRVGHFGDRFFQCLRTGLRSSVMISGVSLIQRGP